MKVILNDHVEHLGERGQSVEVKAGYARNFLLPKGLAYLDTPGNQRLFNQEQKRWQDMDLVRRTAAEVVRDQIKDVVLHFERRAGEKDVLFGSVNAMDITAELAEKGFEIDKRRVHLEEVIKELGAFEVEVQIHHDIKVNLPVHVVRPGEQLEPETEPEAGEETEAATEAETADE
ncbi:MAG: 50S ribosomal protein L9 [Thermoanaerobaculales bacterium]|nr:50S ribosomal protein L9 [Thermoanaerobaculales bacterium]